MDNIAFTIGKKEVFGIVGPDGAGKTTLIRMLCGLLKPDSGTAELLGYDLIKQTGKIKDEIGYLSQKFSLYADLTIDENIEFFAELHGVKNFKDRRNELLEFTRLEQFRSRLAGRLSGGMKQKLALACTLIHKPKIIFLDEPTTGVDPVSRRDFWKILSELHNEGVTIVISTPYMDEAERFNNIAMMNNGKVIMNGSPASLKKSMNKIIAEIVTDNLRNTYNIITGINGYEAQLFGDRIDIALGNENEFGDVERILAGNNIALLSKRIKPVSLENVFIHMLKES